MRGRGERRGQDNNLSDSIHHIGCYMYYKTCLWMRHVKKKGYKRRGTRGGVHEEGYMRRGTRGGVQEEAILLSVPYANTKAMIPAIWSEGRCGPSTPHSLKLGFTVRRQRHLVHEVGWGPAR